MILFTKQARGTKEQIKSCVVERIRTHQDPGRNLAQIPINGVQNTQEAPTYWQCSFLHSHTSFSPVWSNNFNSLLKFKSMLQNNYSGFPILSFFLALTQERCFGNEREAHTTSGHRRKGLLAWCSRPASLLRTVSDDIVIFLS